MVTSLPTNSNYGAMPTLSGRNSYRDLVINDYVMCIDSHKVIMYEPETYENFPPIDFRSFSKEVLNT